MELALIATTAVSVVLAITMTIVAWRIARVERVRSEARVAALAHDLRDTEGSREPELPGPRAEPARTVVGARPASGLDRFDRAPVRAGEMFRAGASDRSRSSLATVVAVGSFAVAIALALVIATSRGGPSISESAAAQQPAPARRAAAPLELVALSHDRAGDRITIRGVVRNPRDGANVDHLTATVYLFDREGGFLKNGGAAIDQPVLTPGAGSTFAVTVDHATNVARYRVSFKNGDRVVPHVDNRHPGPTERSER